MLDRRAFTQVTDDWHSETKVEHPVYREAAYALLRVTMGVIFLTAGFGKFMMGVGTFASGLQQDFAGKLPMALVIPFGYALPFIEVAIGLMLALGLFNFFGLVLAALVMIALTFGKMIGNDPQTVAHNLSYSLIFFALLWASNYNGYSLDRLLRNSRPER